MPAKTPPYRISGSLKGIIAGGARNERQRRRH
jgi:hypothetical protein